jgi:hypothetical protein
MSTIQPDESEARLNALLDRDAKLREELAILNVTLQQPTVATKLHRFVKKVDIVITELSHNQDSLEALEELHKLNDGLRALQCSNDVNEDQFSAMVDQFELMLIKEPHTRLAWNIAGRRFAADVIARQLEELDVEAKQRMLSEAEVTRRDTFKHELDKLHQAIREMRHSL